MMHLTKYILLLLAITCMAASCRKEEIELLPPITQEGQNTFGCLVDGKAFLPYASLTRRSKEVDISGPNWYISANRSGRKPYDDITIIARETLLEEGKTYILSSGPRSSGPSFIEGIYSASGITFYTDSIRTGQLHITRFDQQERIIAGTFWFDAQNRYTSNVVQIREGRFDLKIR